MLKMDQILKNGFEKYYCTKPRNCKIEKKEKKTRINNKTKKK